MTQESTNSDIAQRMSGLTAPQDGRRSNAVVPAAALTVAGLRVANRVYLAPLSGISDVPFRRLARRFGAGLVFSEMVASGQFVSGCNESQVRAMRDGKGLHVVQLAGRDPQWMGEAARRLVDSGVDLIDINMGCPAKKVVGGQSGSALMREPELALKLVEATVEGAGAVPVSLKMRLGWDHRSLNAGDIAERAVSAGVRMVTVHGRTRAQFYEGQADWRAIGRVRGRVDAPFVANGDLVEPGQVPRMLRESGADALMIGRGAQGRPWLPGYLAGQLGARALTRLSLAEIVREHYATMLEHYGKAAGLRHARKHLGWYLQTFTKACGAIPDSDRLSIMTGTDTVVVGRSIGSILAGVTVADVEPGLVGRPEFMKAA